MKAATQEAANQATEDRQDLQETLGDIQDWQDKLKKSQQFNHQEVKLLVKTLQGKLQEDVERLAGRSSKEFQEIGAAIKKDLEQQGSGLRRSKKRFKRRVKHLKRLLKRK